jgi:thiamine biosynthesis lipoprotein
MGSTAHVVVDDGSADLTVALAVVRSLLTDLEARWSRFLDTSELSAVNAAAPVPVHVSAATVEVVELAVAGWHLTAGGFDPTVGAAVVGNGYADSFEEMGGRGTVVATVVAPAVGCSEVVVDVEAHTVGVPKGVQLDLGGVGKGRAADLAADLLTGRGLAAACIDVGGDVRVFGGEHLDGGWAVAIEDPFDATASITTVALTAGAVATSARTRRCWTTSTGIRHHLVDPSSGEPARSGLAQVSVLAAEAAWAEMIAKAAFVAGHPVGAELVEATGASALFVTDDGDVVRVGAVERFER